MTTPIVNAPDCFATSAMIGAAPEPDGLPRVRGHSRNLPQGLEVCDDGGREALGRIETMVLTGGSDLPLRAIREQIASAIQLIVHQSRLKDGTRRITHVTEVVGMEGDVPITQDLFTYEVSGTDQGDRVVGRHKFSGIGRPRFWPRAQYFGEDSHLAAALGAATDRAH